MEPRIHQMKQTMPVLEALQPDDRATQTPCDKTHLQERIYAAVLIATVGNWSTGSFVQWGAPILQAVTALHFVCHID